MLMRMIFVILYDHHLIIKKQILVRIQSQGEVANGEDVKYGAHDLKPNRYMYSGVKTKVKYSNLYDLNYYEHIAHHEYFDLKPEGSMSNEENEQKFKKIRQTYNETKVKSLKKCSYCQKNMILTVLAISGHVKTKQCWVHQHITTGEE